MDQNQSENIKKMDDWIATHATDLPVDDLIQVFDQLLQQLQKRILVTLSDVTLYAILDRVLFQSRKDNPLLNSLKIDQNGLSVKEAEKEIAKWGSQEIILAFRSFIIELMNILGNLTSGILSKPLQKVLSEFRVLNDVAESDSDSPNSPGPKGRQDREDQ